MKNRYFQFLRGILIFVVILIHTIYLNNEKYINCINIGIRCLINFCVPLFIFISGYFVNKSKVKDNPRKYIKSRFYKIVIPLVCFSFVYTMIDYFTLYCCFISISFINASFTKMVGEKRKENCYLFDYTYLFADYFYS